MGNATAVRRGLELHPDPMVKVSPTKQRMVQRAVARARAKALLPFTMGEELKGDEGSLNRFSEQIFLKDLVDDHNSGAKHLELHQPVCLGYQYGNGVVYGNYSTPFLICNAMRGVNSEWPLHLGFDSTFGLSNKKFELLGITTNSLRRHANPVCLCILKQECSTAYRNMYTSMEGAVFELAHNLKLCKKDCEMCDSVREQIEQGPMCDLLTPPKSKKGSKPKPLKFKLPLAMPMCDNTTKFSKFIDEMFPVFQMIYLFAPRTLPALLGRRNRMENILIRRLSMRSGIRSWCAVSNVQARLLPLFCRSSLFNGCGTTVNIAPPSGSRPIGPRSEETTC